MRRRSGIQGVATSPVIVGAVTVLVVIVAVFLAYNANNGLPFVSTYDIKARVPNANALVKGNEVRIGGSRVGTISAVKPVQVNNGGQVEEVAELDLKLDKSAEPLPVNSTMIIRPKSPLGLKYLQITPGNSSETLAAGETLALSQAKPEPVDIDQFFDMFNEETRTNIQHNLSGFGNAFAGRGPQLNEAFATLRKLAESSGPVLRSFVAPSTNFSGFWHALEELASTVAPVALTNSHLFVVLDRTFGAFARVSRPFIQETISKSPPFLDAAARDLPVLRPFLNDSARFFTAFAPGAKALATTSPTINAALRSGVPALNQSPQLFAQLEPTADALLAFQEAPGVVPGINLLIDANELLKPPIRFFAPAQTVCNYLTIAFRNLASTFSETNGVANWAGALANEGPSGPNGETMPASAPANGPEKENHLHANLYPNTAAPGQTHECEAGNVQYQKGVTTIGNVPGNQGTKTSGQIKGQGGEG